MTTERKRILIVDDHLIVREGLKELIGRSGDLTVCGEAGDVREALQAMEELQPDLAVVDISLPGVDGFALMERARARWPDLPLLALSMHSEEPYADRALRAGAQGYIMKEEAPGSVLTAIRYVLSGGVYLSPRMQASWVPS